MMKMYEVFEAGRGQYHIDKAFDLNMDFAWIENRILNMDRSEFEKIHRDNLDNLEGEARANYKNDMLGAMYGSFGSLVGKSIEVDTETGHINLVNSNDIIITDYKIVDEEEIIITECPSGYCPDGHKDGHVCSINTFPECCYPDENIKKITDGK